MNSHNKPVQKAIRPNNQPVEVAFHSAPGLFATLQAVGVEMDVAQLSRGTLHGIFRLGGSRQLLVLSIQTNQDLVLHGNRRPGVLPLSLKTTDQQAGGSWERDKSRLSAWFSGRPERNFFSAPQGPTFRRHWTLKRGLNSPPLPPVITRRSR